MKNKFKRFLKVLGPGLITGSADDDPSGIATYSLAGAQFGYGLLWTALITFPLMVAVQETCARIGVITKKGLAEVIKENYPKPLLLVSCSLLLVANIFNIGADISGMAAAIRLLFPINEFFASLGITAIMVIIIIKLPYRQIKAVFKWLCLALFAYILTFFLVNHDFQEIILRTFVPNFSSFLDSKYLLLLVAVFGTTISPYLFFWQASEEAEEEKLHPKGPIVKELSDEKTDTILGMGFSNIVTYFIIATTAATLFSAGLTNINTAADAAQALRPLAGDFAFLLFAVGIIGTGMLAIPILAGSAAYALAEVFGFPEGLNKSFHRAKAFYLIIILATLIGFLLNLIGLSPIKYLFYSAVLNGLIAPILIAVILLIGNNKKIMGENTNGWVVNLLSVITLIIMSLAGTSIFLLN
ncbi:MAG: divalent metal cation transporter [Patescibacteria group bacterium]